MTRKGGQAVLKQRKRDQQQQTSQSSNTKGNRGKGLELNDGKGGNSKGASKGERYIEGMGTDTKGSSKGKPYIEGTGIDAKGSSKGTPYIEGTGTDAKGSSKGKPHLVNSTAEATNTLSSQPIMFTGEVTSWAQDKNAVDTFGRGYILPDGGYCNGALREVSFTSKVRFKRGDAVVFWLLSNGRATNVRAQ
jgi:hypothetical protein